MPTFNMDLRRIVMEGDDIAIRRTIDRTKSGIPSGVKITKAWLTIKTATADADPGLVQKVITTANQQGVGKIENDGTGDVNPIVRFDLLPADTLAIGATVRFYDIQLLSDENKKYTCEAGRISAHTPEITKASG